MSTTQNGKMIVIPTTSPLNLKEKPPIEQQKSKSELLPTTKRGRKRTKSFLSFVKGKRKNIHQYIKQKPKPEANIKVDIQEEEIPTQQNFHTETFGKLSVVSKNDYHQKKDKDNEQGDDEKLGILKREGAVGSPTLPVQKNNFIVVDDDGGDERGGQKANKKSEEKLQRLVKETHTKKQQERRQSHAHHHKKKKRKKKKRKNPTGPIYCHYSLLKRVVKRNNIVLSKTVFNDIIFDEKYQQYYFVTLDQYNKLVMMQDRNIRKKKCQAIRKSTRINQYSAYYGYNSMVEGQEVLEFTSKKIQAIYRGWKVRSQIQNQQQAAIKIQTIFRNTSSLTQQFQQLVDQLQQKEDNQKVPQKGEDTPAKDSDEDKVKETEMVEANFKEKATERKAALTAFRKHEEKQKEKRVSIQQNIEERRVMESEIISKIMALQETIVEPIPSPPPPKEDIEELPEDVIDQQVTFVLNHFQTKLARNQLKKACDHIIFLQSSIRMYHIRTNRFLLLQEQLCEKKLKLLKLFERNRVSYVQRAMFFFNTRHDNYASLKEVNTQLAFQASQRSPLMSLEKYDQHLNQIARKIVEKCKSQSFANKIQRVYRPTMRKLQLPEKPLSAPSSKLRLSFAPFIKKKKKPHPLTKRHSTNNPTNLILKKKPTATPSKHARSNSASHLQIAVQRKHIREASGDSIDDELTKKQNDAVVVFVPPTMRHVTKLQHVPTEMVIQAIVKSMFAPGSTMERVNWSSVILFNHILKPQQSIP